MLMPACASGLPADDSAAFQRAIDAAVAWAKTSGEGVAVLIPPGTYEIRQTVEISGSNVVLRGSGVSKRHSRLAVHEEAGGRDGAGDSGCRICCRLFVLSSTHSSRAHCPHPQVGQTTLYVPVGLQAVYGSARAWEFGGGFLG